MDYRKIFESAFSHLGEKYPFSDDRTVVDNVLERAKKMEKNDSKYVKELYEITVPNVPVKKSKAPLIAGIAALTVSAAGIGFFAGGSFMAANMPDGAPMLTPLAGGYSDSEDDVNITLSDEAAGVMSETSPAITSAPEEHEMSVATTAMAVAADIDEDGYYHFSDAVAEVCDVQFDGRIADIAVKVHEWSADHAPAFFLTGADLVFDQGYEQLDGMFHFSALCDIKTEYESRDLRIMYFGSDGNPELGPVFTFSGIKDNYGIRYYHVGTEMTDWKMPGVTFERMIVSPLGLEIDLSGASDFTVQLARMDVRVLTLDGEPLPMSRLSAMTAINEDTGRCYSRIVICPVGEEFDFTKHNRVSLNGFEIKFSEFDTVGDTNICGYPEDILSGNVIFHTGIMPYAGDMETVVTSAYAEESPEAVTTVTYPQEESDTAVPAGSEPAAADDTTVAASSEPYMTFEF